MRRLRNATVCVLIAGSVSGQEVPPKNEGLFRDEVLAAAVRKYVFEKRDSDKPLTAKDVENISVIHFKGHTYTLEGKKKPRDKIRHLAGLEKCRSLAELDLEDHHISDLTPLKGLTNLQSLTLKGNRIQDLGPLAGLHKLQYLQLEDNEIADITPLAALKNMRSLYLGNNRIAEIDPVSGLTKLSSLYLGGNRISNIQPLADLRFLDTIGLEGNQISNLSPLLGLTPSRWLFLQNNKITDIGVLVEMARKDREKQDFAPSWHVYLTGNPLSDEARGGQLAELRRLCLAKRIIWGS